MFNSFTQIRINVFVCSMCRSARERHSSTWRQFCSSVLVHEYVLWSRMADKGLATDWGPASPHAASQLCKGSWWITVHWGKSTLPPLPTPPAWPACREKSHSGSQQEAWNHYVRAAANHHTQGEPGGVSVSLHLLCVAGCMIECVPITCVLGRRYAMRGDQNKRRKRSTKWYNV